MQFKNTDYQVVFILKSISQLNVLVTVINPFLFLREPRNQILCISLLITLLLFQLTLKSILVDALLRI